MVDLEPLAALARARKVPLIVDNTLASPYLCQPIEWGADIVVHSAPKFLGGHGNALAGVVVESGRFDWFASGRFPSMTKPDPAYHGLTFAENFAACSFARRAQRSATGSATAGTPASDSRPVRGSRMCE